MMSSERFRVRRLQLFALFGFNLAWGVAQWWSVSRFGLGTSRDSVEYLFTSLSLARGDGFVSFMGHPYVLWPPLYPALLSVLQIVGVTDPLDAALVLQLLTFLWIAALTAWLFTRLFPRDFALAFLGNALAGTGVALTWLFQAVGSDYLFIALVLSMVYLCNAYITHNRLRTIWLMALAAATAMLQRYVGITLLFTAAWVVFQYSRTALWERFKRTMLLGLSIIPVGIWLLTLPVEAVVRDSSSSFFENIYWFTFSILSLFFPDAELYGHPVRLQFGLWGLWLGVIAGGIFVWRFRKSPDADPARMPLFLFGVVYTAVLVMVASLTSFNRLDGRFVSPVFIPLAAFLVMIWETTIEVVRGRFMKTAVRVAAGLLILTILGLSGYRSLTSMKRHYASGSGYTSSVWMDNNAIDHWKSLLLREEYLAFSNYPAGVAVQTWRVVLSSPRRTAHPNAGEAVIPLDTYLPSLFEAGKDSFLIWIEPNEYSHVYSVDDMRNVAEVVPLYEGEDGGVYRILPLK